MSGVIPLRARVFTSPDSRYTASIPRDFPQLTINAEGDVDLGLFILEADRGIAQEEIAAFQSFRDLQLPTLILVAGLWPQATEDSWDFDDMVMLINRVLENAITPYLVLHDDDGVPSGLYDLARDLAIEQRGEMRNESEADLELKSLIVDFKEEWDEEDFQVEDFTSGLRVVAIPYVPERRVGVHEAQQLITTLQQAPL